MVLFARFHSSSHCILRVAHASWCYLLDSISSSHRILLVAHGSRGWGVFARDPPAFAQRMCRGQCGAMERCQLPARQYLAFKAYGSEQRAIFINDRILIVLEPQRAPMLHHYLTHRQLMGCQLLLESSAIIAHKCLVVEVEYHEVGLASCLNRGRTLPLRQTFQSF